MSSRPWDVRLRRVTWEPVPKWSVRRRCSGLSFRKARAYAQHVAGMTSRILVPMAPTQEMVGEEV